MSFSYREIHIPSMLIAVVIGYQLGLYFLHLFRKSREEKLPLNRILLAFAILFIGVTTSIFIRIINNYYANDVFFFDITYKLVVITYLLSVIAFLIIINHSSYHQIINPTFTYILTILNFIPVTGILFINYNSYIFQYLLIPNSLSLVYIVYFELKLMKKTSTKIRKRFIFILIGEILFGLSLLLGGQESAVLINENYAEIIWIIAIYIAIIGLLIIFLGIYRFPTFLEFGWKDNLLQFYIIDSNRIRELYSFDFRNSNRLEVSQKEKVISRGIIGIDEILGIYSGEKIKHIEKIVHGDLIILLAYGEYGKSKLLYVLIVDKDMVSFNYFINSLKNQFEGLYSNILITLNSIKEDQLKIFKGFDNLIFKLLL